MLRIKNIALSSVSLMSLATPALAQQRASVSEEIVITARRRDEVAQDVPLVVNAVTSQALEKLNIRDFKDIQSLVPGLTLTPGANGVAPSTTLRGVDYQTTNSGNNGTVQFYLNDGPISSGFLFQSMFDVGQIEVLRGPQGTLRGIASPSGSITITTRKPDMLDFGGYLSGNANSIGGINVNGAVNTPIIKGGLALRVADMPLAFRQLQGELLRRSGGDREMVEILSLVLHHDEQAVLCAVELALEGGVPTKTHILNILRRLIDGKDGTPPRIDAPQALVLRREPKANVARYDTLRDKDLRHAS